MRSIIILTAATAVLAWLFISQLPEGEAEAEPTHATRPQEVQSVALDGYGLPMAELRASLATHAGDLLDTTKLDTDRGALQTALVGRGYLSAKVGAAQVMFDSAGGAFITFAITRGPLFHLRSVEVVGATERDAGIVTLSKGEVVRTDRLEHARAALAERLVARGNKANLTRSEASVVLKLAFDEPAATVDVVLAAR